MSAVRSVSLTSSSSTAGSVSSRRAATIRSAATSNSRAWAWLARVTTVTSSSGSRDVAACFTGCSNYPDCDFTVWNKPLPEKCPTCGALFLVEKVTKRHGRQVMCHNEDCDYVRSGELAAV